MDEIMAMVKVFIGDVDYGSDEDLKKVICVAASFVSREIIFDQRYVISILNSTITPDPTDPDFINFVSLKSAILLLESEVKVYAKMGVSITDGPSKIDTSSIYSNISEALKRLYAQYDLAKMNYGLISGQSSGGAIITPTTVERTYGNCSYRVSE